MRCILDVLAEETFRHVGGGPRGLFLLLRYVFIASASYLLIFQPTHNVVAPAQALTIALALASNVALSFLPPRLLFAWWVTAPMLAIDTLWVSWALHALGGMGGDFFLLYAIVLVLAAVGERPALVAFGAAVATAATVYEYWSSSAWTTAVLLRAVFLFTMALFYAHALARIRRERRRGDANVEWALVLEQKVAERTAELTRLYETMRDASSAKTDFLASMSHEVRTPLHIIIGYADMLVDGGARRRPTARASASASARPPPGSCISSTTSWRWAASSRGASASTCAWCPWPSSRRGSRRASGSRRTRAWRSAGTSAPRRRG